MGTQLTKQQNKFSTEMTSVGCRKEESRQQTEKKILPNKLLGVELEKATNL